MKPLAGVRVVVTRATHQAEELARPLREHGAEIVLLPAIGIAPPDDIGPLQAAAASLDAYDWIIFTSANAVNALAAALNSAGRGCKPRVAAVGSGTRDAAEESGFRVDRVPEHYVAESLVQALAGEDLGQKRILIPSAAVTRDVVAPALRDLGARVDVVVAYQNVTPPELSPRAREVFQRPAPDWVAFASPSAVTNLMNAIGTALLQDVKIASIGPVTSEAVTKHGLVVAAEASVHTIEGLVQAILDARLN